MKNSILFNAFLESTGVCTDTRKLQSDNIFFALKGDNFNGNHYAKQAIEEGALYSVIDEPEYKVSDQYILVDDVLTSLQEIANHHRNQLGLKIIALTGSNGKTTTKELINKVLSKKYKTVATVGNLNNHIGVPLTLLSMDKSTEIGIVEMGANHLGEIAFLSNIAQPDYGLITNFGKAHIEGFGSEENIVKGKSELFEYLNANDKIIIANTEDKTQMDILASYKGIEEIESEEISEDIILIESQPSLKIEYKGTVFSCNISGKYNFNNIRFAIAIGEHFKVSKHDIIDAIKHYSPNNNRSQILTIGSNTVMLDAYNANPSSMMAALDNFYEMDYHGKIAILGDMFELGESAQKEHQSILDYALHKNIQDIYLVGENFYTTGSTASNVSKFKNFEDLKSFLNEHSPKDRCILIKGSRGMALERVVELLK